MTDSIQARIRQYLAGDNDEDHRKLLKEAASRIDELEADLSRARAAAPLIVDSQHGQRFSSSASYYRAPPDAWPKL